MKRWGIDPNEFSVRLERNDIIVDSVARIGANEVTRMGATEPAMERIADLIARAAKGEDVRDGVAGGREDLSLTVGVPPYEGAGRATGAGAPRGSGAAAVG